MQPTPEQVKELLIALDRQIPNPYIKGRTYPAVNPFTGEKVKVRRSFQVGSGREFLHIYAPCTLVIKSPTGEILSRQPSQMHFRGNLSTYSLERID